MKTIIITFALLFFTLNSVIAQVIPLGLYIDIDGTLNFWEGEANHNGNLEDTVIVTFENEVFRDDLRNIRYDQLTFIEYPDEDWTSASYADPSRVNDTTIYTYQEVDWNLITAFDSLVTFRYFDTVKVEEKIVDEITELRFTDDIIGAGLTDSIIDILKDRLSAYVKQYWGNYLPYGVRNTLYHDLSIEDTVIDKIAVYDYLVDKLVFYNYTDNKLTSILGYHWDLSVEFDSLRYNKEGLLCYYSRESIGCLRDEYYFEYNKKGQVVLAKCFLSGSIGQSKKPPISNYHTETFKFTYDKKGILNSKSILQKDGEWKTLYYYIK